MEIFIALGSILLGLVLLTFGGNALVDGAVTLAKKWNISEAIIGLTIVAVGTSMPELIVSLLAAISGNTDIAIGNVLGSNIANVFLILGATAIIAPMMLTRVTRFFDLPILMLVTLLLLLVSSDVLLDGSPTNMIGRIDGIVFLLGAVGYILYSLEHNNMTPDESDTPEVMHSLPKAILWVGAGVVILFIGGKVLVTGAVDLAKMAGLSEAIIGLTIVALGTSAPEFITSILAARRGNTDIAVGNIVGSNIMNILIILGISAFIAPLPFNAPSYIDLLVSLLAPIALLILAQVWTKNKIHKKEGIVLLAIYILYTTYLIIKELQ